MTFGQYTSASEGHPSLGCPSCGSLSYQVAFSFPANLGFVLKEGDTGGWASKGAKENRWRKEHTAEIARRQKEHHAPVTRLVPNYEGKEADRWSDIQDHVRSTKGREAADTYNPLVAKEKV